MAYMVSWAGNSFTFVIISPLANEKTVPAPRCTITGHQLWQGRNLGDARCLYESHTHHRVITRRLFRT